MGRKKSNQTKNNSERNKRKTTIIKRDTSSWRNTHSYKFEWRYPKRLLSYDMYNTFLGKINQRGIHVTWNL